MKLKLGVCILLVSCLNCFVSAQSSPANEVNNTSSVKQEVDPEYAESQSIQKQKALELLVEKSEKKIFRLQTYLYVSLILLFIVSFSTLFFWGRNKKKIIQLRIETELNEKQRTIKKTDITLQAICTRLEAMRERTPRGRTSWQPSSVKMLLERAERLGLLPTPM